MMKKIYLTPLVNELTIELEQRIAVCGVGSTTDFTEDLTEETTDKRQCRCAPWLAVG